MKARMPTAATVIPTRQQKLKSLIGEKCGIATENLFLGNGSDEAIDLLMRIFAEPGKHNIVAIAPSYGMYGVAAAINNLEVRQVLLNEDFTLPVGRLLDACDDDTRLMFICSPNNPTGNAFARNDIMRLAENFNGILVVDEAYVDFSADGSVSDCISECPNVVIPPNPIQSMGNGRSADWTGNRCAGDY